MKFESTWLELEEIILSEVIHAEPQILHLLFLLRFLAPYLQMRVYNVRNCRNQGIKRGPLKG